ncbi:ABC transporter permease [Enterococcus sp. LJL90]
MFNFIRGDFYRLLHTKSFWITEAVVFVFTLIAIFSMSTVTMVTVNGESATSGNSVSSITGFTAIQLSLTSMLLYFMLPLIILVLGSEYSKGTLKNIVTVGVSRTSFFFGKFISFMTVLFAQILGIMTVSFVVGTIVGGTGFENGEQVATLVYYMFGLLLMLAAISSLIIIVLYLTKNTAVCIILAIILPTIINTVHIFKQDWKILDFIDFQGGMDNLVSGTLSNFNDMLPAFAGSIITMVLCLILSNRIFNKQDL